MLRRLAIAAVFVIVGAAISVLVAWGCAMWPPQSQILRKLPFEQGKAVLSHRFSNLAIGANVNGKQFMTGLVTDDKQKRIFAVLAFEYGTSGCRISQFAAIGSVSGTYKAGHSAPSVMFEDVGWPIQCLQCEIVAEETNAWLLGAFEIPGSKFGQDKMFGWGVFPVRPTWPGMVVNTVLYATLSALMVCGPSVLRRGMHQRRRRCGLCVQCGYDLRGRGAAHERCPECGTVCVGRTNTARDA